MATNYIQMQVFTKISINLKVLIKIYKIYQMVKVGTVKRGAMVQRERLHQGQAEE